MQLHLHSHLPEVTKLQPLQSRVVSISHEAFNLLQSCLLYDPEKRATTQALMGLSYFTKDQFPIRFTSELNFILEKEREENVLEKLFLKKHHPSHHQKPSAAVHHQGSSLNNSQNGSLSPNGGSHVGGAPKGMKLDNNRQGSFVGNSKTMIVPQKISIHNSVSLYSNGNNNATTQMGGTNMSTLNNNATTAAKLAQVKSKKLTINTTSNHTSTGPPPQQQQHLILPKINSFGLNSFPQSSSSHNNSLIKK